MASELVTQVIAKHHDVRAFACARPELNDYLKKYARQTSSRGGARTFVTVPENEQNIVIGFYTLVASEMTADAVPTDLTKGLGRYPLPGFRLARLAVDSRYAGLGLGRRLFLDAGIRCLQAAEHVGAAAMFIDAKDIEAARFYRQFGAQALPDRPLVLVLPLATVRTAFRPG